MIRCTVKYPKLAQYPAKGISPDDAKTMSKSEIHEQTKINNAFNGRANILGDILESKLKDVDMTWCKDGCVVISCDNTIAELEQVINDEELEIQPDRSEIGHKIRTLKDGTSEEDIDEVFEPLTVGELKKLKSRSVTNQYLAKKALEV